MFLNTGQAHFKNQTSYYIHNISLSEHKIKCE